MGRKAGWLRWAENRHVDRRNGGQNVGRHSQDMLAGRLGKRIVENGQAGRSFWVREQVGRRWASIQAADGLAGRYAHR